MDWLAPVGLVLLAGLGAIEALHCLADRLLASAFVYAVCAAGLLAGAAKAASGVF